MCFILDFFAFLCTLKKLVNLAKFLANPRNKETQKDHFDVIGSLSTYSRINISKASKALRRQIPQIKRKN